MSGILQYWPLLPFIAFVVVAARRCGFWDRRNIGKGKRIVHVLLWCMRALVVGSAAVLVAWRLHDWWTLLPLLVLGAFLFSAVFRYRLNALRGRTPFYLSPSNYYDWFFISGVRYRWTVGLKQLQYIHKHCYNKPTDVGDYTSRVHRAGRWAYIAEITLSVLSLVVLGAIVNQ